MRLLRSVFLAPALLMLASCASIIEGSSDTVNVATVPPSQSSCSLANSRGSWNGAGESQVTVKRSISALDVRCNDPVSGQSGSATLDSDVEPWVFGNVLLGGVIGLGVDWMTGAAYDYPDHVSVPLAGGVGGASVSPVAMPSPTMGAQPVLAAPAAAPFAPASAPPAGFAAPGAPVQQGVIAAPPVFLPPRQ